MKGSSRSSGARKPDKRFVRDAFARIAPRYDALNTLLSFGIERRWRRRVLLRLEPRAGERLLDLCAGTLTLSRDALKRTEGRAHVVSVDFCSEMLLIGRSRLTGEEKARILPLCGDAESLPLSDASFDGALITYGIRNLEDVPACLEELHRCLKPGGRMVILDFLKPRNPLAAFLYGLYLRHLLPRIGGMLSGSYAAYRHLADSIGAFMEADRLIALLKSAGFADCGVDVMTFGIAGVFYARKGV